MSYTARSVIFDIASNYGEDFITVIDMAFFFQGERLQLTSTDYEAHATTYESGPPPMPAFDAFNENTLTAWQSEFGHNTNQRLIIRFNTSQTFDEIKSYVVLENSTSHPNKLKIQITPDSYTNTTYNASVTNGELLFDHYVSFDSDDYETHVLIEFANYELEHDTLVNVTQAITQVFTGVSSLSQVTSESGTLISQGLANYELEHDTLLEVSTSISRQFTGVESISQVTAESGTLITLAVDYTLEHDTLLEISVSDDSQILTGIPSLSQVTSESGELDASYQYDTEIIVTIDVDSVFTGVESISEVVSESGTFVGIIVREFTGISSLSQVTASSGTLLALVFGTEVIVTGIASLSEVTSESGELITEIKEGNIFYGSARVQQMYLGSAKVLEAYIGSKRVF